MKDLSISQSYLLCTLNESGKLPALSTEIPVCLLAGGLIDLILAKSVAVGTDKKLAIVGKLSEENQHLSSLYTYLKESKPMKVDGLVSQYAFTFFDKRLKLLIDEVGVSLSVLGCATAEAGGVFGKTQCFIPDKKTVDHVIQNIRAELLEDGVVSDNMIALVSLMDKSNHIKRYFSKYEKDQLMARLKEIKDSESNKLVTEMVGYIDMMIAVVVATTGAAH